METNLTVIGLDRIGISIGLALTPKGKYSSVAGWDGDPVIMKRVRVMNAFSTLPSRLEDAVRTADLLMLTQPLDEVRDTFSKINKWIKKDVVVLYFSCLPAEAASLSKDELKIPVHFVALTPSINPKYLHQQADRFPYADLFENSRIYISHPADLPPAIIQLATEVARLLGADPFFADMDEVEGLQTLTYILPYFTAATLMDEILHEPGWRDAGQLAGSELAGMLGLLDSSSPASVAEVLVANRENTLRVMANLGRSLSDLATLIESGDSQKLQEKLSHLRDEYFDWLSKRGALQAKKAP